MYIASFLERIFHINYHTLVVKVEKLDSVHIKDQTLKNMVAVHPNNEATIKVPFCIFDLITAVGTIQTEYTGKPTHYQKWTEFARIIGAIKNDIEFKLDVEAIQNSRGQEILGKYAENIGVGISVIVADYVLGIDMTTLERIIPTRNEKRADWKTRTLSSNLRVVVESKGTTTGKFSKATVRKSFAQKNQDINANIRIVSFAYIESDIPSHVHFIDPPVINQDDINPEKSRKLSKAEHYSAVFNLLGQPELSRYFILMKDRIMKDMSIANEEKNNLFFKIKREYIKISIQNKIYFGKMEYIDEKLEIIQFTGIQEDLISYDGFLSFENLPESKIYTIDSNKYYLSKDGICIIIMTKNNTIIPLEDIKYPLKHYLDSVSISDIDNMDGYEFEHFITFLLRKIDIRSNFNEYGINRGFDILLEGEISLSLRLIRNKRKLYLRDIQESILGGYDTNKKILITNGLIQTDGYIDEYCIKENIFIIDRNKLKDIIGNPPLLRGFIGR